MKSYVVGFRLKETIYRRIKTLADRENKSVSEFVQAFVNSSFMESETLARRTDKSLENIGSYLAIEIDKLKTVHDAIVDTSIQIKSKLSGQTSILPDELRLTQKRTKKKREKQPT